MRVKETSLEVEREGSCGQRSVREKPAWVGERGANWHLVVASLLVS